METVLKKGAFGRVIRVVDRWFDVMKSQCINDVKPECRAFGLSGTAKTVQDAALCDMDQLITNARNAAANNFCLSSAASCAVTHLCAASSKT